MFLRTETHKTKNFQTTSRDAFGGWKIYWKLYKQALAILNEFKRVKHSRIKFFLSKAGIFFLCIFKPFKKFYSTKTILKGVADSISENDVRIRFDRKNRCTRTKTRYLFKIPFLTTTRDMTDKELEEVFDK